MEELLNILKDLHDDVDYEACDTLIDDGIFNSFDIVTLIGEIKGELGVTIPANEIVPENFNSAAALYALIERLEEEA